MKRHFAIALSAILTSTGCATLETSTQRVRVLTEPAGAHVAALEDAGRKELGPSPVHYERSYSAYRCGNVAWLTPVATTLLSGAAGFGLAYVATSRNDKLDSAWQSGGLFAAVGLAAGVAIAARCRMKDGTVPEHRDIHVVFEASKEGHQAVATPLLIPSKAEEIRLVLPPAIGSTEAK